MGATQSIVDLSLVSNIGVPTQKLDTKITLKAVNRQLIEITEGVLFEGPKVRSTIGVFVDVKIAEVADVGIFPVFGLK
ncbi:hypothetical protein BB559_007221 [Furculomyces boomerangus]|uniref:Uncharacterized protein n=2 Tax=Harpellales TaxID=61421 RepID=A0A2T9XYB3_9FUNG|nr:hypothetical protein BB559_007221 [Furculomyces boomerangus]PVZ97133.1 hypothetical protein BB558_006922 [Smittium angustum]